MGIIGLFNRKRIEIEEGKTETELDIECELKIMEEKEQYGRVSTMTMRLLRERYGTSRADRAMYRQQKRKIRKSKNQDMIDKALSILSAWSKPKNTPNDSV